MLVIDSTVLFHGAAGGHVFPEHPRYVEFPCEVERFVSESFVLRAFHVQHPCSRTFL